MPNLPVSLNPLANPFFFENHSIRTAIDESGKAWFCAKDVFETLDITWSERAGTLKNYPDEWICPLQIKGESGSKETIFIKEPAVYKAMFSSRKPEAEICTNWVCEEVLPRIREFGYFGQLTPAQRSQQRMQLHGLKLKYLSLLTGARDAFVRESAIRALRDICNLLGEPMPDVTLIGKDPAQLPLGDL